MNPRTKSSKDLYPIEVIDEDSTRFKVHYVGYSNCYDEWKDKEEIVDISDGDSEVAGGELQRFSLYLELGSKIKAALNSSRKESPVIRIDMPFDRLEFDGGLGRLGTAKRNVRGVQHYSISAFQYLNPLLGVDWHFRGLNVNGDFCYVILSTVEFYLYRRRSMKEYVPVISPDLQVLSKDRNLDDMLIISFVKWNGTPDQFGTKKDIFVNN